MKRRDLYVWSRAVTQAQIGYHPLKLVVLPFQLPQPPLVPILKAQFPVLLLELERCTDDAPSSCRLFNGPSKLRLLQRKGPEEKPGGDECPIRP